tara:strand:- start:6 stop:605 length:600 start_codon:yes stop_codon:yes gene_type:complete
MARQRSPHKIVSIINALDTTNHDWDFSVVDSPKSTTVKPRTIIHLSFTRGNDTEILFNDLSMGFKLYDSEWDLLLEKNYPLEGTQYNGITVNADDVIDEGESVEKIEISNLIRFGKTYKLDVWVKESGILSEGSYEFVIPKPNPPYSEWVWNDDHNRWESPNPVPNDGRDYFWSEDKHDWDLVPGDKCIPKNEPQYEIS